MKMLPCLALVLLALPARADLRLPSVIGDHMVLQQDSRVAVWGWDEPGRAVTVSAPWLDEPARGEADADGRFEVELRTPKAGGPHELRIQGSSEVVLRDVLIGEVWICAGQSNMEWSVGVHVGPGVEEHERVLAECANPKLRLIDLPHNVALGPTDDVEAEWRACEAESLAPFSAVGYFFGRELQEQLDVPVGLIGCNWGGTVVEAWMSEEGLAPFEEFAPTLDRVRAARAGEDDAESAFRKQVADWWRNLDSEDPEAHLPSTDASSWRVMPLPASWRDHGMGGFDGVVWFRREVELPAEMRGRALDLHLGPIDDMDTVWVDGSRVGGVEEMGHWQAKRRYEVPARHGEDGRLVIAVRVLDTGGVGGINGAAGDLKLVARDSDAELPLAGDWSWRRGPDMGELGAFPSNNWFHRNSPTALYNGMASSLVPYGIRGTIWYQGESNRARAKQYRELFPAMIRDWRRLFRRPEFPFYYVQIAPYTYGNDRGEAAELREAQTLAMRVPNTGMAVTMDIGNPRDIHPGNKDEVGRRLSLWALAKTYGRTDLAYSGPLYRGMQVEGERVRLVFDHAGTSLVARGGDLTHFQVAGEDRRFHPARAVIEDGSSVLVWSDEVPEPVAVRYAWGEADEPNLFNGAGLPAPSFRTDDWPMVTR